jgi:hypothetical protein
VRRRRTAPGGAFSREAAPRPGSKRARTTARLAPVAEGVDRRSLDPFVRHTSFVSLATRFRAGQRCGILEGGVAAALERLTGELPQNVALSIADWTASVRRPRRLRTAMVLDTGDAETADVLLAGELKACVVERLGPSQLAIRADGVAAAQAALRSAGHELAPGLERLSGRWSERDPSPSDAERVWAPDDPLQPPDGKQVSTIAKAGETPARPPTRAPGPADSSGEDPVDVVLSAIESGSDLFILYGGAEGTTQRQITPYRRGSASTPSSTGRPRRPTGSSR